MKIVVIDNYDSFTYNLVHYVESVIDNYITVYRNDEIAPEKVLEFDKIIFSPGPGLPFEAGNMPEMIKIAYKTKSILGVCLGHQAIAEAFGAKLMNLNYVFHGLATPIKVTKNHALFQNIPNQFNVGRYHSWVVDKIDFSDQLEIMAEDENGNIMAFYHKQYDVCGVQFHPESILTEHGLQIIKNWVNK